jgi:hypothetical protein
MPRDDLAGAVASLRHESERLWGLAGHIVATEDVLQARSIAAKLDAVADHVEAVVTELMIKEWD